MNRTLATLAVAVTLTGCSLPGRQAHPEGGQPASVSVSAEDHREGFLRVVRGGSNPEIASQTDEQLVLLGESVCANLSADRFTFGQVNAMLDKATGGAGTTILGASISAFCPEQLDKLKQ